MVYTVEKFSSISPNTRDLNNTTEPFLLGTTVIYCKANTQSRIIAINSDLSESIRECICDQCQPVVSTNYQNLYFPTTNQHRQAQILQGHSSLLDQRSTIIALCRMDHKIKGSLKISK